MLEEHISSGIAPVMYMGNLNPLDDDFWLVTHNHPLAEQDRSFGAIVYPGTNGQAIFDEGIVPALHTWFHLWTAG